MSKIADFCRDENQKPGLCEAGNPVRADVGSRCGNVCGLMLHHDEVLRPSWWSGCMATADEPSRISYSSVIRPER